MKAIAWVGIAGAVGFSVLAGCTIHPQTPAPLELGNAPFRHADGGASSTAVAGVALYASSGVARSGAPAAVAGSRAASAASAAASASSPASASGAIGVSPPLDTWPTLFDDPLLAKLVGASLAGNFDLRAANARVTQARALLGVSQSALLPSVVTEPSFERSRTSGTVDNALPQRMMHNWTLPVEADYEVDLWGKLRAGADASREGVEAAIAERDAARLRISTEVASDYLTLRFVEEDIDAIRRAIELRQSALVVVNYRVKAGAASDLDGLRASSELETATAELAESVHLREDLVDALAVLTGVPATEMDIPGSLDKVSLPDIPVGVPADVVAQRPDLFAAARRLDAASLEVGIARTAWLPTLTLTASGGFASRSLDDFLNRNSSIWGLAISAAETLYDGGRRDAVLQSAQASVVIADANYREIALESLRQVQDALNSIAAQKERVVHFEKASTASEQAARLSLSRYQHGYVSYLEVIDANRDALNVERQLIHSRQEAATATVSLIRALGGGWTAPEAPQAAQPGVQQNGPSDMASDEPGVFRTARVTAP